MSTSDRGDSTQESQEALPNFAGELLRARMRPVRIELVVPPREDLGLRDPDEAAREADRRLRDAREDYIAGRGGGIHAAWHRVDLAERSLLEAEVRLALKRTAPTRHPDPDAPPH